MKNLLLLSVLFTLPMILFAQKTKFKTIKYYNSKITKEEFFVLKKSKNTKHGNYKSYHKKKWYHQRNR